MRDLRVERQQSVLPFGNVRLDGNRLLATSLGQLGIKGHQLIIQPMHCLELVGLAEFDLADSGGLEDSTAGLLVRVHLHHVLVDGRVDHNPRATTQLTARGNVDVDWVLVGAEGINNLGTEFEHLLVHVAGAARETTPVGENDERQVLAAVEILDCLSCLERRVRKPHLASLRLNDLPGLGVGRIGGDAAVHQPSFNCDHTHGLTTETSTSHHHRLAPASKVLLEGALVKEARLPLAIGTLHTCQHVAGIVGRLGGREINITLHRI
mmetsp:Transcript_35223/g.51684  ORF Transcript_35223/g.51684 Transcript_35223/m.51684 type:complete len:266 (-) Transcript_35223:5346-6143(-)